MPRDPGSTLIGRGLRSRDETMNAKEVRVDGGIRGSGRLGEARRWITVVTAWSAEGVSAAGTITPRDATDTLLNYFHPDEGRCARKQYCDDVDSMRSR